jgi:uncharacterized membrane protein YhaH (DUF805 family)
MTFLDAMKTCLRKFIVMRGRAPRAEYWWFYLANVVVCIAIQFVGLAVIEGYDPYAPFANIYTIYWVIVFIPFLPGLSVTIRRLHDRDRSAWSIFVPLVPVVGSLVFLFWLCQRSTEGENRFGADPLGALAAAAASREP